MSIHNVNYYNVPKKPRYTYARTCGRKFLNSLHDLKPPINPFHIIDRIPNWKYAFDDLEGEEGYIFKKRNKEKYLICIDNSLYGPRVIFTGAHEIGHIILGHFITSDFYNLPEHEKLILDKEADAAAGEILMPKNYILHYANLGYNSISKLAGCFGVSDEAMKVRLGFLNLGYLVNSFNNSVSDNKLLFLKDYSQSAEFREEEEMSNSSFKITIDNNGRLTKCPDCTYSEFGDEDIYCIVCGNVLVNKCSNINCNHINKGNALYCGICGEKTNFNINEFTHRFINL